MKALAKSLLAWRTILALVVIALIALPIVVAVGISAPDPWVAEMQVPDVASSTEARALASRVKDQVLSPSELEELLATEGEINGLLELANRAFPRLAGVAQITSSGLEVTVSLHVPENPLGGYLNFRAGVVPSAHGLEFSHSSLGKLSFSGGVTKRLFRFLLDLALSDDQGSMFIDDIESVAIRDQAVAVRFRPIENMDRRLSGLRDRFAAVREELGVLGDPALVGLYHRQLCEFDALNAAGRPVSLAAYLATAFELAADRVTIGNDVIAENRAAILALGMALGDGRIEVLIGSVSPEDRAGCRNNHSYVRLGAREDLRLHFIISAVLQAIADGSVSSAVGEFKELLDADLGGSGFSFVDLAADMAGVRLAESLLGDPSSARRVQAMLAETREEQLFFPSISDLRENLPQAEFELRYGGLEDARYQAVVAEIARRIDSLPLFGE